MLLTNLISVTHPITDTSPQDIDIFASALSTVFPDDTRNQHGDPGATVMYTPSRASRLWGREVKLSVCEPERDEERRLFAHYLWNAGVWLGERVAGGEGRELDGEGEDGDGGEEEMEGTDCGRWEGWSVEGETVLELGAGLGLTGIVSCLAGASEVVISDYPTPSILTNLTHNITTNIPPSLTPHISATGHKWGDLTSPFSLTHAHHFTRILAADCLWMPWTHRALAQSMAHFLSDSPNARVFVAAGFHTGRAKVAPFWRVAGEEGLVVESIEEVDVEGGRREWREERDGGREDVTGRKRWLVIAKLKRAGV